ncbi:plasmid recombination protein [Chromobacterium sp. IIBBL 290-4]|uniref:plasmid recombination protein n=1 Tax=Chromobacterium sp. IIBBL 290-4 TaxID=2953890 RepID=UPI0020B8F345|nr:plasmid recombination protein [Chromobacterium sp. IIBBL 290-4]UTH72236.1 plasmid recombination protein [Chromobacterium sp. IIBBL 290-4]
MPAYLSAHAINGKRPNQNLQTIAAHNTRSIAAELRGGPGARIDPARVHLNRVIAGPETAEEIVASHARILEMFGAQPKRKDQIVLLEVVVDPKQPLEDPVAFFEATKDWLVSWYDCPLLHAVVHFDEAELHAHYLFVPIRDGRLQGDVVMGKRPDMARMQRDFQAAVCKRFGIDPPAKMPAAERKSAARQIVDAVIRQGARLSADQKHQLGKALQVAPDFQSLAMAFGVAISTPAIPIGVDDADKEAA